MDMHNGPDELGNEKAAQLGSCGGLPKNAQRLGSAGDRKTIKQPPVRQPKGRYPDTPGFKDQGTGREAAIAYAPQAPGRRAQVLAGLNAGPATAEEIGERVGLHWYLTRPRLSELQALGLVAKSGERGRGALGGGVNVWRLTTAEERSLFAARKAAEAAE